MIATFTSHTLPIWANWSQFLGGATLVTGVAAMYHRHNCHERWCPALVKHGQTHCRVHRRQPAPR